MQNTNFTSDITCSIIKLINDCKIFLLSNHVIDFKEKCPRLNRLLLLFSCTHSFSSSGHLNVTD